MGHVLTTTITLAKEHTMDVLPEFRPFGKIPRLRRDCIITEKIDGTNASVFIPEGRGPVVAGSRTRWLRAGQPDNFGFRAWVVEHVAELVDGLGPGHHFGEWWGQGIQRGYGLRERRFSLFNTSRWEDARERPACCDCVPILYRGLFTDEAVDKALDDLRSNGSRAHYGYPNPEGIVVYLPAANQLFKVTLENDGVPKSAVEQFVAA